MMNRPRYKVIDNMKWDDFPLKISYADLRKIQERAFNAGYDLAEFTYRDREFRAPDTFKEWFDGQTKCIGGYLNDSREIEVIPENIGDTIEVGTESPPR